MKKYFLGKKGKFYKASLHTHTNVSDGSMTPQEVKDAYVAEGYSIVAYTDHEVLVPHNELTDENFLAITAYEASVNERYDGSEVQYMKVYHFNMYSKDKNRTCIPCFNENCMWLGKFWDYVTEEQKTYRYPNEYTLECVNGILKRTKEHDFLISYNHPVWSHQSYPDYIDLENLWGVEVYNYDSARNGHEDTETPFVDLLMAGKNVVPLATDDSHSLKGAFGGFVMIEAEKLDYETVFAAMEDKRLYSSQGPLIEELYVEDDKITIRCSKVERILLVTERRWVRSVNGKDITEATFDLSDWKRGNKTVTDRKKAFVRLVVLDGKGKRAWTRAYFEEEFESF